MHAVLRCLRSIQVGAVRAGRALAADGGVSGSAVVAALAQVALRHACGTQDEQDALNSCSPSTVLIERNQASRHAGARPVHPDARLTGAGSHVAGGAVLAHGGISGDSGAAGSQPVGELALLAGCDIGRADLGRGGLQCGGGLVAWQGSGRAGGQGGQANRYGQQRLLQVSSPLHAQTQHPVCTYPGGCCGRCCSRGRRRRSGRCQLGTGCSPWRRRQPQC